MSEREAPRSEFPRWPELRQRIADAARRSGRSADDIQVLAVTKGQSADALIAAVRAGFVDVGENRAQELVAKAAVVAASDVTPRWHFIGRLQRNKVRGLAPLVTCWQSIDRLELIDELARFQPQGEIFLQVSLAGEPQKGGCAPTQLASLIDAVLRSEVRLRGLMTVPPLGRDPRPYFAQLRHLRDSSSLTALGAGELSMGMSSDFEAAIEEGATMIRIGQVLFDGSPLRDRPTASPAP